MNTSPSNKRVSNLRRTAWMPREQVIAIVKKHLDELRKELLEKGVVVMPESVVRDENP